MADQSFDADLTRLFAEHRAFPDSALFARRVEEKLNRGWSVRRGLIGVLGLGGGLAAVVQVAGPSLAERIFAVTQASVNVAQKSAVSAPQLAGSLLQVFGFRTLPFGGEVVWLVGGLLAVAGAFLATRLVEEI